MSRDGSNRRRLVGLPGRFVSSPNWSPDGKEIVFEARFPPTRQGRPHGDIYAVRRDISGLRALTTERADEAPAWSPNGKRIVFVRTRQGSREIYVMNADGSQKKRLTTGLGYLEDPDWRSLG